MADDLGPIIGIDLGTTNSVAAFVVNGKPQVIEEAGEALLPSIVGIDPQGQLVTGILARNQLAAFPDRTVASIKRRMGSMDPVSLGEQSFTPPEISAIILRRLKDRASRVIGQPVNRAVITVPAFFDENQRQATRTAAALAGLTAERIINEPTAATLVYHAGTQDRRNIAVYDFGGGTLDVSVVRMEAGVIEVLCSHGDVHLGGDDLDEALLNLVARQFQEEHGIDLRQNAQARYRLLLACEQAKRRLSTDDTTQIAEEFIGEKDGRPLHLKVTLTRAEFEELIEPFISRTIDSVDEALRGAKLTVDQIDDLVLVGGSTRIPMVEQRLRQEFLREPSRAVDPDLAVALGAAVQAAMIAGRSVGPVLVDVTQHTLGIEALVDDTEFRFGPPRTAFSPIIHRNTPLPVRFEQAYFTLHEDQESVVIHILQGEHLEIHRNRSIGEFRLKLKSAEGDRRKIIVRFDLTLDGTLKVTATQTATGVSQELVIENTLSQFQTDKHHQAEARLDALFEASPEMIDDGQLSAMKEWSEFRVEAEGPIADGQTLEDDDVSDALDRFPEAAALLQKAATLRPSIEGQDAAELNLLCKRLKEAVEADDSVSVTGLCAELDDLLFYVR